jgi:hypothetical protein
MMNPISKFTKIRLLGFGIVCVFVFNNSPGGAQTANLVLKQDDKCKVVEMRNSAIPPDDFYNYSTADLSGHPSPDFSKCNETVMFLYNYQPNPNSVSSSRFNAPDAGLYLIILHNTANDPCLSSGTIELTLTNLPDASAAAIAVHDDPEPDAYDFNGNTLTVVWQWNSNQTGKAETDGMVLRLSQGQSVPADLNITINFTSVPEKWRLSFLKSPGTDNYNDAAPELLSRTGAITLTTNASDLKFFEKAGGENELTMLTFAKTDNCSSPQTRRIYLRHVSQTSTTCPLYVSAFTSSIPTAFSVKLPNGNNVSNQRINLNEDLAIDVTSKSDSPDEINNGKLHVTVKLSNSSIDDPDLFPNGKTLALKREARDLPLSLEVTNNPSSVCSNEPIEVEIQAAITGDLSDFTITEWKIDGHTLMETDNSISPKLKLENEGENHFKIECSLDGKGCKIVKSESITITRQGLRNDQALKFFEDSQGQKELSTLTFPKTNNCSFSQTQTIFLRHISETSTACPLYISASVPQPFRVTLSNGDPVLNQLMNPNGAALPVVVISEADSPKEIIETLKVDVKFSDSNNAPLLFSKTLPIKREARELPPTSLTVAYPPTVCSDEAMIRASLVVEDGAIQIFDWKINEIILTENETPVTSPSISHKLKLGNVGEYGEYEFVIACNLSVNDCHFSKSQSITIKKEKTRHGLVFINEILYDPRKNDLGLERIELRNDSVDVLLGKENWAIWFKWQNGPNEFEAFWKFPAEAKFTKQSLLVVNWLDSSGVDDIENQIFFTNIPSQSKPDLDAFFFEGGVRYSPPLDSLLLGGLRNSTPFAVALIKNFTPAVYNTDDFSPARESCNMVDFIQFGGGVSEIEQSAQDAGLWYAGSAISFVGGLGNCADKEGFSFEYNYEVDGDKPRREPGDFFKQARPSIGRVNLFGNTPPNHLLISEICVRPTFAEFIEIYNPDPKPKPNEKPKLPFSLNGYYLTDSGGQTTAGGEVIRPNNYVYIVKESSALAIDAGDFMIHFPPGASIGQEEYKTIAFNTAKFEERYGRKPDYEILPGTDVPDMIVDKLGSNSFGLDDAHEEVILFKWVKPDNLVDDVDYAVWGDTSRIAVYKTKDLRINGAAYKDDTPPGRQRPIAKEPHAILKSWQRRQVPREFGEECGDGNGITGDNETSENLALAFQEAPATPSNQTGTLDLEAAIITDTPKCSGNVPPNGVVNPFEDIRMSLVLKNIGTERTGPLYTILQTTDLNTIAVLDSGRVLADTSTFLPINPNGGVGKSLSEYRFATKLTRLPDVLNFTLLVFEKPIALNKSREGMLSMLASGQNVSVTISCSNAWIGLDPETVNTTVLGNDNQLKVDFKVKNFVLGDCGGASAGQIAISIDKTSFGPAVKDGGIEVSPPTNMGPGDVYPGKLYFVLDREKFKGQDVGPLRFIFKWQDGGSGPVKENPVTLSFAKILPSFKIKVALNYFGDAAKRVKQAVVRLEPKTCGKLVKEQSAVNGVAEFNNLPVDQYKVTVVHAGVPDGAITSNDTQQFPAGGLANSKIEGYKRIAADVNRDKSPDGADIGLIALKAGMGAGANKCLIFPVEKDWTFIDAGENFSNKNFYDAPDSIVMNVGRYNMVELSFAGILYGDVDSSAIRPQMSLLDCQRAVSGKIVSALTGKGVSDIELKFPLSNTAAVKTDADGKYTLNTVLKNSFLNLTPFHPRDSLGTAVNLPDDLSMCKLLKCDNITITRPQSLALDVNCDNRFGNSDLEVLENYLQQPPPRPELERVGKWLFIRQPLAVDATTGNVTQDYLAILCGDASGVVDTIKKFYNPPPSCLVDKSVACGEEAEPLFISDLKLAPGDEFTLPLRLGAEQAVSTANFNLAFNTSQLALVRIEKNKALPGYKIDHKLSAGNLQAQLDPADAAVVTVGDLLSITFRAIGQIGDSSRIILQDFSVNNGPGVHASVRVEIVKKIPDQFFLAQNYPNPFNPITRIKYGLPKDEHVQLQIFNMVGQIVRTVVDKRQEAGYFDTEWNGTDRYGRSVPSGVYFMRMKAGKFLQVRKLMVLR